MPILQRTVNNIHNKLNVLCEGVDDMMVYMLSYGAVR